MKSRSSGAVGGATLKSVVRPSSVGGLARGWWRGKAGKLGRLLRKGLSCKQRWASARSKKEFVEKSFEKRNSIKRVLEQTRATNFI